MTEAYVALGANLGDPRRQVLDAMQAIDTLADTRVTARSSLYLTPPWGVTDQPAFINAVVAVETALSAHDLLIGLQALESLAGRTRDDKKHRWGPRTLDLDLLLYGEATWNDASLEIPHPRLSERAFVLLPLDEIAASVGVPGQGRVSDLVQRVDTTGCRKLESVDLE